MNDLVAFLSIAVLVIVMPGQDMALTLRATLLGGRRRGVVTACGVATGLATWTVATSAGLVALMLASESLFVALKLIGAAYLIYLGLQALRGALRPGVAMHATGDKPPERRHRATVAYRQGLISNLGNPKIAVFFTSLLPQFSPSGDGAFVVLLALGLLFCVLTLTWLILYVSVIARAGDVLRRPAVRRWLDGLTGTVLVAFGLRLATAARQ